MLTFTIIYSIGIALGLIFWWFTSDFNCELTSKDCNFSEIAISTLFWPFWLAVIVMALVVISTPLIIAKFTRISSNVFTAFCTTIRKIRGK